MMLSQKSGPAEKRRRSSALDAHVGMRIRAQRKDARMTLQALADRLGIAYQQLQKYETGVNRVGAGRLMEIAEILDIPVASLFALPGAAPQRASSTEAFEVEAGADVTKQGHNLLVTFLRIKDPAKRMQILSLVRAMAEGENH